VVVRVLIERAPRCREGVEAADLRASVGVMDMVNTAPTTPGDLKLDELRSALSKALERFSAEATSFCPSVN
jgi:hypothetical protein